MSLVCLCTGAVCFSRAREAGGSRVSKFTVKHRNPPLRDFHTVPRLRARSQPPTESAHVCVCVTLLRSSSFYSLHISRD